MEKKELAKTIENLGVLNNEKKKKKTPEGWLGETYVEAVG